MRRKRFFSFVLMASSRLATVFASESPDAVSIRVDVPTADSLNVVEEYQQRSRESLDFGVSSWVPDLKLTTRQKLQSDLEAPWPALGFLYVSESFSVLPSFGLSLLGGFSYLQLRPSENYDHRIHILMGSIGMQSQPAVLGGKYFETFFRASVLPAGFLAASSLVAAESNRFDMPVAIALGGVLKSPWRRPSGGLGHFVPMGISLSAEQILSSLGDEDLSGFGLRAGIKFQI